MSTLSNVICEIAVQFCLNLVSGVFFHADYKYRIKKTTQSIRGFKEPRHQRQFTIVREVYKNVTEIFRVLKLKISQSNNTLIRQKRHFKC